MLRLLLLIILTAALSIAGTLTLSQGGLQRERAVRATLVAELEQHEQSLLAARQALEAAQQAQKRCERGAAALSTMVRLPDDMTEPPDDGAADQASSSGPLTEDQAPSLPPSALRWPTQRPALRRGQGQQADHGDPPGRPEALARLLELDSAQTAYYQNLLTEFEGRVDALFDRVAEQYEYAGQDPLAFQDMLQAVEAEKAELDAALDAELARVLHDEQQARYLQLPAESRGVGPNAGLDRLELQLLDLPFLLEASGAAPAD